MVGIVCVYISHFLLCVVEMKSKLVICSMFVGKKLYRFCDLPNHLSLKLRVDVSCGLGLRI
jgi:hypothetical protein